MDEPAAPPARREPAALTQADLGVSLGSLMAYGVVLAPWAALTFIVGPIVSFLAGDVSTPMTLVLAAMVAWGWTLYSWWTVRRLGDARHRQVLRRRLRALGAADVELVEVSHLRPAIRRLALETRGLRANLEEWDAVGDPSRIIWEWLGDVEALPEAELGRLDDAEVGPGAMRVLVAAWQRDPAQPDPRRAFVARLERMEALLLRPPTAGYR